jgi:hypothetical protein
MHSSDTSTSLHFTKKYFHTVSEKGKQQKKALQSSGHLPGRG